jgi:hypothetical protein
MTMRSNELMTSMHSLTAKSKLVGLASLVAGVLSAGLLAAPSAGAALLECPTASSTFGICPNSFTSSRANDQAGAHSDFTTAFQLNTTSLGNTAGQLKSVSISLPPGEVGNPQAIPHCTDNEFQDFNCPSDAQVGILNANLTVTPGSHATLTADTFGPTSLTSDIATCPGFSGCSQVTFTVADPSHINVGDFITICGVASAPCDIQVGGQAEHATVRSVDTTTDTIVADTGGPVAGTCGPDTSLPTNVDFCPTTFGMFYPHASGDLVYDETIQVNTTAGFTGLDFVKIGPNASGNIDTNETHFFPSNGKLDLETPLQFTHTAGEDVNAQADTEPAPVPLFNMTPDPGHVATLSGTFLFVTITIEVDVRSPGSTSCDSSSCQLVGTLSSASTLLTLEGSSLTLWGVPGDPSHDAQRCGENLASPNCQPSSVSKAPFLTNPTNCSAGGTATVTATPYQGAADAVTIPVSPPTGCDQLSMSPKLSAAPDTSQVDTPAGYGIDLQVPQNEQPYSLATPTVQNVSVTLPAGTALSPAVANGLLGCTDAQFAAGSCPDASKVGTVAITTPLLPDQLTGSVYIGAPIPGQMYRLFIAAAGDNVTLHLAGQVTPNPTTGQLTTVFNQNPQLPFSDLDLKLFGGPLAALANPESCGTFTTTSDITPWSAPGSGADPMPSSSFNISGCSGDPFAPTFTAGTTNPSAGAFSPFTLTFSRSDADDELSSISATLPPGLFAKIAGVPLCSNANASAGSCGAASRVGTATVGSGAGSHPLFLSGPVYLTGPYKGGAYGLATVVPAVAGPYNLGTVVVRQSLRIDPNDAHVTAASDPFPTILDGVPLRIKTVNLTLDRGNFIVNPTSCAASKIGATITSVGGAAAPVSSRFQVGGCRSLPFAPSLGISLSGNGQTTSGKHPTLTATLKAPKTGQANIDSAKVTLPLSIALDPKNSQVVCSVAAAAAINCPAKTIVGKVTAVSPLLPHSLSGNVYLVQGIRTNKQGQQIKTLPSLLIPLNGDVRLNLHAKTSVDGAGRLVSTFSGVPDAAVSNFKLTINGGRKGILVVTGRGESICKSAQNGTGVLTAHSKAVENLGIKFGTPACGGHKQGTTKHAKSKAGRR